MVRIFSVVLTPNVHAEANILVVPDLHFAFFVHLEYILASLGKHYPHLLCCETMHIVIVLLLESDPL